MMLIDKMLTKPDDRDMEKFAEILLKYQPGLKHYIEENFSRELIQSKITYDNKK